MNINIDENEKVSIGKILQYNEKTDVGVFLNKNILNKHIFITGVTGSGKTTTCKTILKNSKSPFIVIEPAKTEYRELIDEIDDIIIFSLGENDSAASINPFELQENETIDSRIGLIKGAILSSFHLDAAIPQIIEKSMYKMYEKKKWNIYTSRYNGNEKGKIYSRNAFPTFIDLINVLPDVIEEFEFSDEVKSNYLGAIKSRLNTFVEGGIKKYLLCNSIGLDFSEIIEKKVVFELEDIKDSQEKSFIIAIILANINQAVKNKYKEKDKQFRHITLIEEAHRFLSKPENSYSNTKIEGIRIFTDMLAEVRKYGEGLIIVDQIPNKLVSEVLKNTNTKIVHKIFSKDDKELIGNTMLLNEKQMSYLSNLEPGEAVIFTDGWYKPVLMKIDNIENVKENKNPNENNYISNLEKKKLLDLILDIYISTPKEEKINFDCLDVMNINNIKLSEGFYKEYIQKYLNFLLNNENIDSVFICLQRFIEYINNNTENTIKKEDKNIFIDNCFMDIDDKNFSQNFVDYLYSNGG